jgi:5-formyltetrahydrofolate cyclo-ligase
MPTPTKPELRRVLRAIRDAIDPATAARAAAHAAAYALDLELEQLAGARTVALYAAFRSELDTAPLAAGLAARGVALAYPRIVAGDRRLVFHRATPDQLVPATFGIPEPLASAPVLEVGAIDAIIIPAVGFDRRGNRLGWGQGHYDCTLAHHAAALRIGYAFACQVVDEVPAEPADQSVDILITEDGVHRVARRA